LKNITKKVQALLALNVLQVKNSRLGQNRQSLHKFKTIFSC
jgi:hypothetical protein